MAQITLQNPNEEPVSVHVLGKGGWFGLGGVDKTVHVGAKGSAAVDVPKGNYRIRYQFTGSSVWEGDPFTLSKDSAATITLQTMKDGNYRIRPSSGSL